MESTEIIANGVAAATSDITLWSMFWQAAFVVKLVMLGLVAASVWCWGIIIDKSLLYARTQSAMDRFEDVFWSGRSLDELYDSLKDTNTNDMAAVFMAAMGEWKRSLQANAASFMNLTQRIDKVLDVTIVTSNTLSMRWVRFMNDAALACRDRFHSPIAAMKTAAISLVFVSLRES